MALHRNVILACLSLVTYGPYYSCVLTIGAALENLSAARVGIMGEGTNACCSAVAIAVRYAAVRKQFASKHDDTELPIIEYQLHVSLLVPQSLLMVITVWFTLHFIKVVMKLLNF
jgi:hypothetical protein